MSHTERFSMDSVFKRFEEDVSVLPINKSYIKDHDLTLSAKGVKDTRRKKYLDVLRFWGAEFKKDFKAVSKDEIIHAVDRLRKKKRVDGNGVLAESTREVYKTVLKSFYKWLEGNDEVFPEKVRWIKPKLYKMANKLPEDVFTEKEVGAMIAAADDARDQAIISMLYESGTRADEFLGIRLKDIQHEESGVRVRVDGKTGERSLLLVSSVPYLTRYLNIHPAKDDSKAFLWYSRMNGQIQPLSYSGLKSILKLAGQRGKVKKPLNAHNFRHSRASHLAKFWTEAQLCNFFGWTMGSKMVAKYVHLSGRDSDSAVLKLYGLAKKEDEVSRLSPLVCKFCTHTNAKSASFCENCGRALSAVPQADDRLLHDARFLRTLVDTVDKEKFIEEFKRDILVDVLKAIKKDEITKALGEK